MKNFNRTKTIQKPAKRIIAAMLFFVMMFTGAAGTISVFATSTSAANEEHNRIIEESAAPLHLYYDEEAPYGNENIDAILGQYANGVNSEDDGWERWSIPIGNGYFGANLFGRTETERIQITEKTLVNPYKSQNNSLGGLNNFSETYIDFGHPFENVTDYSRKLDLKTAISTVDYVYNGVSYSREYFTSYPDKALVIKLSASEKGALSFVLRPTVPYEQEYAWTANDGATKTGEVTSEVVNGVGQITLSGKMGYYDIDFAGLYRVYTDDGVVSATTAEHTYSYNSNTDGKIDKTDIDGTITVSGATNAYIIVTLGSDYELTSETFTSSDSQKPTFDTDITYTLEKVGAYLSAIEAQIQNKSVAQGYEILKSNHVNDYSELLGRVSLDLDFNEEDFSLTTDELLLKYENADQENRSSYLEALYFQYGRYLLIASSRPGTLPANLQGTWNRYRFSPWSSGYWHNINVQMNYWPAFSTNIAETFEAYAEYNAAYMEQAQIYADSLIKTHNPDAYDEIYGNGWCIGTGAYPNNITSDRSAGNLGFTTQLFWDYYSFTRDENLLLEIYDILIDAARYITKCVEEDENGNYLVAYCDSPEMYVNGVWYYTSGTTYAQTFAYLNNYHALLAAKELGIIDSANTENTEHLTGELEILKTVLSQIDKYDPIIVGLSGQIKEFREEDYYGSVGDQLEHRHISQLVGLYPGNLINSDTPAWIDAAKVTLENRGDGDHGWAYAHRMALWARVKDGDKAAELLHILLLNHTATNLWDLYPPFQIDGNLGATAAIAEMLLQSHSEYIEPLAALPALWDNGSYTGLVARGGFEVAASWQNSSLLTLNITSLCANECKLSYPGIENATIVNATTGRAVSVKAIEKGKISFATEKDSTYIIYGFEPSEKIDAPNTLTASRELLGSFDLTWSAVADADKYNVYTAVESSPVYTLVGSTESTNYTYTPIKSEENSRTTFRVTAVNENGTESEGTLCYFNPYDLSASIESAVASVLVDNKLQITVGANGNAAKYKLFMKESGSESYVKISESNYPIITTESYNPDADYAVTVISYYGEESELFEISSFNTTGNSVNYDPENILLNKTFVPTAEAKAYEYNSTTYSYNGLTDGILQNNNGRFSTKSNSAAFMDATVDLGGIYALDEFRLYYYAGNISYAGKDMLIQAYYNGKWTDVYSVSSSDYSVYDNGSGTSAGAKWLAFDMKCVKAEKIRIYSSAPNATSITFYEAECSGSYLRSSLSSINNIFENAAIEAGDTASDVYSDSNNTYGYDKLIDGSLHTSSGRYSTLSNKGNAVMDAVITLNGSYNLSELRLYDFTNVSYVDAQNAGRNLEISVLFNGVWTTVVSHTTAEEIAAHRKSADSTGLQYLSFEFESVSAEAIRIIAKSPVIKSNKYISISMYELQCTATPIVDEEELVYEDNILSNKTFIPGTSATDVVSGYGYDKLTDGSYDNKSGRFSTKTNNSAVMDATIELGASYALSQIKFYFYNGDVTYAANDITVSVYSNGNWYKVAKYEYASKFSEDTVTNGGTTPGKSFVTLDLSGIKAEKIRVYASRPVTGKSITFYEITCMGAKLSEAIDRTELLSAISKLPCESTTEGLLYDFIANEDYVKFKEYAQNYAASQEMVDAYTQEILEYYENLAAGKYTVNWYDKNGNLIKTDDNLTIGSSLTPPDVSMSESTEWYSINYGWASGMGGTQINISDTTVFKNVSYYLSAADIEENLSAIKQNLSLFGYVQMNLLVPKDIPEEISGISVKGDGISNSGDISFDNGNSYYSIYAKAISAAGIESDLAKYTVNFTVTVGNISERFEVTYTLSAYSYLETILGNEIYKDAHTLVADMLRYVEYLCIAANVENSSYSKVSALLNENKSKCSTLPEIKNTTTDIGNLADYVKAVSFRIDTYEPNFKLMVDQRVTKITLTAKKYNGEIAIDQIYSGTVYNIVKAGTERDKDIEYDVYLSEGIPIHTLGFDYFIEVYVGDVVVASGNYNMISSYYHGLDATLYPDYRNFVRAMYAYSESAIDYRYHEQSEKAE